MQTDSQSEIYEELWRIINDQRRNIKDLCQVIVHTDFVISKNQLISQITTLLESNFTTSS